MAVLPLSKGMQVLIDDDQLERVLAVHRKWSVYRASSSQWYAVCSVKDVAGKTRSVRMHRVIMDAPLGCEVDHVNGTLLDNQTLDNRRSNLRLCASGSLGRAQNNANKRKCDFGSSQYKGVSWSSCMGLWSAGAKFNGVKFRIGHFESQYEAAKAYNEKAREIQGDFASLNILSYDDRGLMASSRKRRTSKAGKHSKYVGVYWIERNNKWMARLTYKGQGYYLGLFFSEDEAALAFNSKIVELRGPYARINQVSPVK